MLPIGNKISRKVEQLYRKMGSIPLNYKLMLR